MKYKKKIILLLLILGGIVNSKAQKYQPYDTNMVWKVFQTGSATYTSTAYCIRNDEYNYFVKGFILNNGIVWHKVYANILECSFFKWDGSGSCNPAFVPTQYTKFIGMFSNDTLNKKVFFVPTQTLTSNFIPTNNNLIFYSNKIVGDIMSVYSGANPSAAILSYSIQTIDSVLLGTTYHKRFEGVTTQSVNYAPAKAYFIEGVGCSAGVFNSDYSVFSGRSSKLWCFSNLNYTQYYVGPSACTVSAQYYPTVLTNTTSCFSVLSAIDANSENVNAISIYPNPSTTNFNVGIQLNQSSKVSLKLYEIKGSGIISNFDYLNQSGSLDYQISTNDILPGIYILKVIIDEKQYNFKIIKTNGN